MYKRNVVLLPLLLLLLATVAHAKITFSSERNGVEGLYVMDDDGSNQTLLTDELDPFPESWSPDGKQILFKKRMQQHSEWVLFLMNADGTNIRQLTENDGNFIGQCSFSPDGKFIVYGGFDEIDGKPKSAIRVLNIETGKIKVISDRLVTFCDWSPDGKHIIFAEPLRPGRSSTIWIMDADGHNPRELIPNPGRQADNFTIYRSYPRWSPDGQKIVWVETEQKWELVRNIGNALFIKAFRYMIYDLKSRNIRQLKVPKDYDSYGIDWMDDGESVVFTARAGFPLNKPIHGVQEKLPCYIYKYHIRTGDITQLTNDPGWDQTIDWISDDVLSVSPVGKKKVTWGTLKQSGSE